MYENNIIINNRKSRRNDTMKKENMLTEEIIMADNRKMWESLGMDLETHDMLCEVLPVAFGDVYL